MVVGLLCELAQTAADSWWTDRGDSHFVVDGVTYTVSGRALDRFQEWVADTTPSLNLPAFDQATLFTGSV